MVGMVRFGRCSVDTAKRRIDLDGEARHLEPQAFDLLAYLLAHRDRVITKEELLDAVWGDQFVSESALTTRIKEIRQAVGDDGTRQAIVRNFRGRGYRFGSVKATGPHIWLLHNLVEASFDLFRYLLLGDQLRPWELHPLVS